MKSLREGEFCGLIKFEIMFEDGHIVPFNSILICLLTPGGKISKYDNYLSVSNLMNLFLNGNFKQNQEN